MPKMVRKQVYLEQRHERMLKRRARQRGVTEAEIIREALAAAEGTAGNANGRDATLAPAAGQKAVEFMRSLAGRRRGGVGRRWSREELYRGRIDR